MELLMCGPVQVPVTTHVDTELQGDFRDLTAFMGVEPEAALEQAMREWMTRYAVIHHFPKYGFDSQENN